MTWASSGHFYTKHHSFHPRPVCCRCRLPLCPRWPPGWKQGSQETRSSSGPSPVPSFWWSWAADCSAHTMRPSHQRHSCTQAPPLRGWSQLRLSRLKTSAGDRILTGSWSLWWKGWRGRFLEVPQYYWPLCPTHSQAAAHTAALQHGSQNDVTSQERHSHCEAWGGSIMVWGADYQDNWSVLRKGWTHFQCNKGVASLCTSVPQKICVVEWQPQKTTAFQKICIFFTLCLSQLNLTDDECYKHLTSF